MQFIRQDFPALLIAVVALSAMFFLMPPVQFFWLDGSYLVVMAGIAVALSFGLRWLLMTRRTFRRKQPAPGLRRCLNVTFGLWCVVSFFTAVELGFALFVTQTDAFNRTSVSHRWFRRYSDAQKNAEGFRDRRELVLAPPTGVRRATFWGDSFTIGQGINRMEDRFTERIEDKLNAAGRGKWQIANMGEYGWDVSMIEGTIKAAFQQGYQADVFVYVYMLNDIEGYDPRTEQAIKLIQHDQPTSILWTQTYFFNWVYFRWDQYRASRTVEYFPHLADSYRSNVWRNVRATLERIHRNCTEHDTEFRMVFFPFLHNLGPEYPFKHAHRQLAEFCEENGVRYVDLEPVLSEHRADGLTVNPFDNHPNEHCHALAADAIFDGLFRDNP